MESYYKKAINRIHNINIEQYLNIANKRYEEVRSRGEYTADATLIAEYYRRVVVLLQFMSKDSASILMGMSKVIHPHNEPIDIDRLLDICPNLKEIDFMILRIICCNYLQWCSLLDTGNPIAMKYHDIYEPMMKLIERGGGRISIHHHELVGGFGAFSRSISTSRGDMEEFDISDRALERRIKEVEHAEAYLKAYKLGASDTYTCLRCGNKLIIQENKERCGVWYKIKCETKHCYDQNFH
ncbi:hypothetical protein [Paenibacillus tyrfis]|uniref:hypothetical protein n=1 Tax=Paenibacillus tyrfis TaxID=1501230 RepID=UPI00209E82C0|nr:hypothetical protein [Paenibacillus tyrfis]MCP1308415.1 hypothetical protein [Paenibacillus tyrfis]